MKKLMTICAVIMLIVVSNAAQATMLTFTLEESGGKVVGTVSGSVDTSKLRIDINNDSMGYIRPGDAFLSIGIPSYATVTAWLGIEGPMSFGTSYMGVLPNSGVSEAPIGVHGMVQCLWLSPGYVSGSLISGTSTWNNTTLSGLGVTAGTYTWTYNNGADSVVLLAGVPEPATMALLAFGGLLIRRRKA